MSFSAILDSTILIFVDVTFVEEHTNRYDRWHLTNSSLCVSEPSGVFSGEFFFHLETGHYKFSNSWEPNPHGVAGSGSGTRSGLRVSENGSPIGYPRTRNPEPIVPYLKMKEKTCLNTPAGSKARRNEMLGGFQGSEFPGMEFEADTTISNLSMYVWVLMTISINIHQYCY
jgi:hypothetical protein